MTKKLMFIVIVALLTVSLFGSSLALSSSRGMKYFSATIGSPEFLEPNPANMKNAAVSLTDSTYINPKPGWPSPVMCAVRGNSIYASANSQPYFIDVNKKTKTIIRDPFYINIYNSDGSTFATIDDPTCGVPSAWESLVAVADVDRDGKEEIVVNCNYNPNGAPVSFKIYGFDSQGNYQLESVIKPFGSATVAWLRQDGAPTHFVIDDIDRDGKKEIIVLAKTQSGPPILTAFHADGSVLPGFPTNLVEGNWQSGSMSFGSIAVGPVYRGSSKYIVTVYFDGQKSNVRIFNKYGNVVKTIKNLDGNGAFFGGVALADVNRDGYMEIALGTTTKNYLLHPKGNIMFVKNDPKGSPMPPSFIDMKQRGRPQIVFMGDHKVTVYSAWGNVIRTIPTDWYWGPPSLSAPVDPRYSIYPQLIFTDTGTLRVVNPFTKATFFEADMSSWSQSPAVIDMDNDGKLELVMNTVVNDPTYGWGPCTQTQVWDLNTGVSSSKYRTSYWPQYFQNNQNTGSMPYSAYSIKDRKVDYDK